MQFSVLVDIRLRGGISDPAGATIERALPVLGYEGIDAGREAMRRLGEAGLTVAEDPFKGTFEDFVLRYLIMGGCFTAEVL